MPVIRGRAADGAPGHIRFLQASNCSALARFSVFRFLLSKGCGNTLRGCWFGEFRREAAEKRFVLYRNRGLLFDVPAVLPLTVRVLNLRAHLPNKLDPLA